MKVTKAFNFVVEVIVCDCVLTYVLRSPDGKPIYTSDNVTEVVEQMGEIVSQIVDAKHPVKD